MGLEVEEDILCQELHLLSEEAVKKYNRAEGDDNATRSRMALTQLVMCHRMMKHFLETGYNVSEFREKFEEVLDMQERLYREARAANDRVMSAVYLARVRLMTTLSRRLADDKRRQLMAFGLHSAEVMH